MADAADQRIAQITLDEHTVVRRSPEVEHERAVAISDLLARQSLRAGRAARGPVPTCISAIEENRLVLDIARRGPASRCEHDRCCR